MQRVQEASQRLADATGRRVAALWALHGSGDLTAIEFRSLAVSTIAAANAAGVQLADIGLAAEVTRQLGRSTSPLGITPSAVQTDQARLLADIDRLIADRPVTVAAADLADSRSARLAEFARSEPLITVATAVQTGMGRHGASGWVRQVDADPCQICRDWADGVVRNVNTRMARHKGCACIQAPVFSTT